MVVVVVVCVCCGRGGVRPVSMVHIVQKPATVFWNFGRGLLWALRGPWERRPAVDP